MYFINYFPIQITPPVNILNLPTNQFYPPDPALVLISGNSLSVSFHPSFLPVASLLNSHVVPSLLLTSLLNSHVVPSLLDVQIFTFF